MAHPHLSKGKQLFLYIAPFPALAFFKIWAATGRTPGALLLVACLMLIYCSLVIWIARQWDRPSYFDWAVDAYFASITSLLFFWPHAAGGILREYSVTGVYACLFGAAFFPPLFGMAPFTHHYAKKATPQMFWENPIFLRVNQIMTHVWSAIFAICIVLSLYPSIYTRAVIPLALILGFGLPFNLRFPDSYLRRLGLPPIAEQKRMAEQTPVPVEPTLSSLPLPTSAREAIGAMPKVFNAAASGDLSAVLRFMVSGSESFEAYLNIHGGVCTLENTPPRRPDLIIRTPAEVWLSISRKERKGEEAFMQQAFTTEGDLGLLLRMNQLFSGTQNVTDPT